MNIDWNFIAQLEGRRLVGYVPPSGDSGVTIATGVDLGQRTLTEIAGLPGTLPARLEPYIGVRGPGASAILAAHPLAVSEAEADQLNDMAQRLILAPLASRFRAVTGDQLDVLPDAVQTVVLSLAYQYGSIWTRCPRYWQCLTSRDWRGMINELDHFGDAYPTRRVKEANYLLAHI